MVLVPDCLRRLFYFVAPTLVSLPGPKGEALLPVSASDRSWMDEESARPQDELFLNHLRGHVRRVLCLTAVCRDWAALVNWAEVVELLWKNTTRRRFYTGNHRNHPFIRPRAILHHPCAAAFDARTLVAAAMASRYLTTFPLDFSTFPDNSSWVAAAQLTRQSLMHDDEDWEPPPAVPALCFVERQKRGRLKMIPDPDVTLTWPWLHVRQFTGLDRQYWRDIVFAGDPKEALRRLANGVKWDAVVSEIQAGLYRTVDDGSRHRSVDTEMTAHIVDRWRQARQALAQFERALPAAMQHRKMLAKAASVAKRREKEREARATKKRLRQEEEEEEPPRKRARLE